MVGDTILEMMRDGVITNARKGGDRGLAVAGSVLGSAKAIALAAREPSLRIVSIAQTHDPARIEALPDFVCVNSALEVDLLGQVNTETAGGPVRRRDRRQRRLPARGGAVAGRPLDRRAARRDVAQAGRASSTGSSGCPRSAPTWT